MVTEWPIRIVVAGAAVQSGSKKIGRNKKTGQAYIIDDSKKTKPWKTNVAAAAKEQYDGPLLDCALDVEMIFVMPWRKGDFGTGRNAGVLKDHAPLQPTSAPDVLKLGRAIEDALIGTVYRDDSLIVNESLQKRYGNKARVEIRIRPTALTCISDLVLLGLAKPPAPSETVPMPGFEQLALELVA